MFLEKRKVHRPLLKALIASRRITQARIARFVRVSPSYFSEIANGHKFIPVDILSSLARFFDLNDPNILCDAEERDDAQT
ncbi:MAG: helix-turn-helix transcriptional regulator [Candidatus Omnitrophica bacterium]|nr:helix-turn-helix transcriptional regulator [Candidatus Omnitrophota bacterium]